MEIDFGPCRLVEFHKRYEGALIDLIAGCYAEYGERIELGTLDRDLLRVGEVYVPPESVFRVLLDGGHLVGSVAVKGHSQTGRGPLGASAELKRVFLRAEYRRRGLGKRLTRWAFAWAKLNGHRRLRIWSDQLYTTAHRLYRRLGAVPTGERRWLGGLNRVVEVGSIVELERIPIRA
jgi:putative acetyltransferase